jgi:hypothetical protein
VSVKGVGRLCGECGFVVAAPAKAWGWRVERPFQAAGSRGVAASAEEVVGSAREIVARSFHGLAPAATAGKIKTPDSERLKPNERRFIRHGKGLVRDGKGLVRGLENRIRI